MRGTAERVGPGITRQYTTPGDFILTHRDQLPSLIIAFGQALRFRGEDKPFAHYSHAALVVGAGGQLAEALSKGVKETNIEKYAGVEYHYVKLDLSQLERDRVIIYGREMVLRHERYSYLGILTLSLQLLTGARVSVTTDGHTICSGLVAKALERTAAIFPRNAGCMMPADLAKYYGVRP